MKNQAELADKLVAWVCSDEFYKRQHEADLRLQKWFNNWQKRKAKKKRS